MRDSSTETERMVGRTSEIEVLRALPERLADGPAAVVLEGDAGIGKTTLWLQGIELARGSARVLQARPAEIERHAALSGLAELLNDLDPGDPRTEHLGMSAASALALRRAIGREPTTGPLAPSEVALAFADLVDALCATGPVVLAVDDLQWLDPSTARVVGYVLRRLRHRPAGLLACRRGADASNPAITSLPATRLTVVDVTGLEVDELGELIRRRLGASFLRPQLARIHAATAGNPFHALEIARAALRMTSPLSTHGPLPLPEELADLVGRRLAALPDTTREVLLIVAMSQPASIDLVEKVAGRPVRGAFQHALDAGLLVLESGRARFAHPLLAETAYAQADGARRRRLHRRLADAAASGDIEFRARHLAAAVTLPDGDVAAVLERAGHAACSRGAPEVGADLFARAAELTPYETAADRRRRDFSAAEQHALLGHSQRALVAYRKLVDELDPGPQRARVLQRLGMLERTLGTWGEGMDDLRQAIVEAGSDRALEAELLVELAVCAMQAADLRTAGAHIQRATRHANGTIPSEVTASLDVAAIMHEVATGAEPSDDWVPRLIQLGAAANERTRMDEDASMRVVEAGCTLKWLDRFEPSRDLLGGLVRTLWERQQDGLLMPPLFQLCELECWSGRVDRAAELTALLEETRGRVGQQRQLFLYTDALLRLRTGDLAAARETAGDCLKWSRRAGDLRNELRALTLQGSIELYAGRADTGADALDAAAELEEACGYGNPAVIRGAADHIEALLAAGRVDDAARRLSRLQEQADRTANPWAVSVAARSRGLISAVAGSLPAAVTDLERAAGLPVADPVERGRTLLALATMQRRIRQRSAARGTAQRALVEFTRSGATLWITRAQGELDRLTGAGGPDPGGVGGATAGLTRMEQEISACAAEGMTNKEIASTVHLSSKTVETHLTHIYLKLGVRSRTELARRLHEATRQATRQAVSKAREIPDAERPPGN